MLSPKVARASILRLSVPVIAKPQLIFSFLRCINHHQSCSGFTPSPPLSTSHHRFCHSIYGRLVFPIFRFLPSVRSVVCGGCARRELPFRLVLIGRFTPGGVYCQLPFYSTGWVPICPRKSSPTTPFLSIRSSIASKTRRQVPWIEKRGCANESMTCSQPNLRVTSKPFGNGGEPSVILPYRREGQRAY